VILVLTPLLSAVIEKIRTHKIREGREETGIWIFTIMMAFAAKDKDFSRAVIFGLFAGTLIQPFTDRYLTARTLDYGDKKGLFFKTPHWVASLWGIALTQLSYFWTRLPMIMDYFSIPRKPFLRWLLMEYLIFIIIGFAYFFIFEWTVSNWTDWWKRKHCRKIWGIPKYALFAEFLTVAALPIAFSQINTFTRLFEMSILYGLFVMLFFSASCSAAHDPKIN